LKNQRSSAIIIAELLNYHFKSMFELKFSYNFNKDVNNYLNAIYKFKYLKHGRNNIEKTVARYLFEKDLIKIKKSKNKKVATQQIKNILSKWLKTNEDILEANQQSLATVWGKRKNEYINCCEIFFEKKFDLSPTSVYFTTLVICPYYYPDWFMVSVREGLEEQLLTIYHELFHFIFIKHYGNYCQNQKLTPEEFETIKESLTLFLNKPPFTKINTLYEKGYPQEKELRDFMAKEYKKNHNFLSLLNASIKLIKSQRGRFKQD